MSPARHCVVFLQREKADWSTSNPGLVVEYAAALEAYEKARKKGSPKAQATKPKEAKKPQPEAEKPEVNGDSGHSSGSSSASSASEDESKEQKEDDSEATDSDRDVQVKVNVAQAASLL